MHVVVDYFVERMNIDSSEALEKFLTKTEMKLGD